jgi:hypothetical protein
VGWRTHRVVLYDVLRDLALLATLGGVAIGVAQLRRQADHARTTFEDSLAREYRQLLSEFPAAALLGGHPTESPDGWPDKLIAAFVRYIDLCNEQAYLHDLRRVSRDTWEDWLEGIRHQFALPYFKEAWNYVYHATNRTGSTNDGDLSYARLAMLVSPGQARVQTATGRPARLVADADVESAH